MNHILSYESRIQYLDTFLTFFSNNPKYKFYILAFIHYIILFGIIYYGIFFSQNIYVFSFAVLAILLQIIINLYDNGCFMMKLERKYIGKSWFGPYTFINLIAPNTITNNTCGFVFKILSLATITYGVYKAHHYYIKYRNHKNKTTNT